jgi:hypothetical protein
MLDASRASSDFTRHGAHEAAQLGVKMTNNHSGKTQSAVPDRLASHRAEPAVDRMVDPALEGRRQSGSEEPANCSMPRWMWVLIVLLAAAVYYVARSFH